MPTFAGRYSENLLRKVAGNTVVAVADTDVTVYESDGFTLATVYTDRTKTVGSNPVASDANGNLEFFATPGTYVLSVPVNGAAAFTDTIVVGFDPSDAGITVSETAPADPDVNDLWLDISAVGGSTLTEEEGNATYLRTFDVENYGATGDGATNDTSAVQAAIDAAEAASGGIVYFPAGSYMVDALTVNMNGVRLTGADPKRSYLYARSSMTNMVTFQLSGSRFERGGIYNMTLDGNGFATNGALVDSNRFWQCHDVRGIDLPGFLVTMTSAQSGYSEGWTMKRCDTDNRALGTVGGLFKGYAGTTGSVADGSIKDCIALSLGASDWAIELEDCTRVVVRDVLAANDTTTFAGGVYVSNPGNGFASSTITGFHTIDSIYLEDLNGSGTAVCVKIEAPTGVTNKNMGSVISRTMCTPESRTHLQLRNTSATVNLVRQNHFHSPKGSLVTAGNVDIGANCIYNYITIGGTGAAFIATAVTDSGSYNRINSTRSAAYGSRTTPPTTFLDVGDHITNTSDGSVWIMDKAGTLKQVVGPFLSERVFAAGILSDRTTGTASALRARVTTDTDDRITVRANGDIVWGPGNAAADTNLKRVGASLLKTDDKFLAGAGLGVGNSASATTLGTLSKKMEVFDANGTSIGFVPIYTTIT